MGHFPKKKKGFHCQKKVLKGFLTIKKRFKRFDGQKIGLKGFS